MLELMVDMVAANNPAITSPDNPAGNCCEMNQGNTSSVLPLGLSSAGWLRKKYQSAVPTPKKISEAGITISAFV